MDDETTRALNELNLAFYREQAESFSGKRERPWRGWTRLLAWIPERPLSVLDVGCGNGRFGRFLAEHRTLTRYTGLDASGPLLAIAQADPPRADQRDWIAADFVASPPDRALPSGPFDRVGLFGVLHGVPGREHRRALLEASAARLAPKGLLVFTSWCFADDPRLAGRIVAWDRAAQIEPIDRGDPKRLEPGDHLLPWGAAGSTLRFGHSLDTSERSELIAALPTTRTTTLTKLAEFSDDGPRGDLNHYCLLLDF